MTTIFLFFLAGLLNSNMDALKFRWGSYRWAKQVYKYGGPNSWKNKYKEGDPEKGPRFPGSTTIFVFTTDLWHLTQMLWRMSVTIGAIFYRPITPWWWGDLIILTGLYLSAFNAGFEAIFVCKK